MRDFQYTSGPLYFLYGVAFPAGATCGGGPACGANAQRGVLTRIMRRLALSLRSDVPRILIMPQDGTILD